jgi:type II secretory pathway component PulC
MHIVGHKITKELKYEVSLSKISQHILISNLLHVSALFSIVTKYNSFRTVTALHSTPMKKGRRLIVTGQMKLSVLIRPPC